jgi:hypothetical protein
MYIIHLYVDYTTYQARLIREHLVNMIGRAWGIATSALVLARMKLPTVYQLFSITGYNGGAYQILTVLKSNYCIATQRLFNEIYFFLYDSR